MRIKLYENRDFMRRTQIKLMQEEVHIWCIRWKEVIPVFEYYQLMLDQKEKEKMEEYYFYEDRMRYVAGKVITKLVLIQYLEEEEISFLSHKFGKPYYKSISGKQDIEFNISHSGEMILVAFSRDAKIGVDIQEIIDCSEYLEIARSFFEPEEVKNIEESNSKELFFQYWSAKEAYLKAIGVGLTSMEFKDGLTGFTDERAENNQTFFKREQWEGVFKEHKADIVYQFPEKGTPLEMAGQTIYVVRFKENYICPDKNNMLDELERRIPEYMIPSVITFLPRLPQTSNDKIDRGRISKWISASAEENKKVDVAELPQNDLEEQIARIWCKELNIERIGRNDNFYLSGGDSLLIAQVIARMRETIEDAKRWSWDDLLKEMMKTPTIRGVAKILSNQAGENEQDKSLVIIKEAAESSEKKVTVVFHAGTGTLTPYNSLIAYITERSQENEAVMGFTFGDEAEYLAIPTDKIFENLGKKYGRILSELGFTEYTLIGHCVGGLIALETAHYLKDKGKNVSSVTLLSTSIPHKKEETVLADLDMKIFETAVQTSLYNELLLERTFASLIDADIKKAGHQVDNDTLQQVIEYLIFNNGGNITVQALCSLTGKFAEVGAEFQRLHSMSATERMNDLYTTIERPNGQLMEHQRKMLNVLFRVFAQNFRCVSSYIPKVYTGKMRVFDCESAIANFFPSLFSEDKKTWEQYAQGEFLFDTMKGDHISCMNSPYIEENVKKILDL